MAPCALVSDIEWKLARNTLSGNFSVGSCQISVSLQLSESSESSDSVGLYHGAAALYRRDNLHLAGSVERSETPGNRCKVRCFRRNHLGARMMIPCRETIGGRSRSPGVSLRSTARLSSDFSLREKSRQLSEGSCQLSTRSCRDAWKDARVAWVDGGRASTRPYNGL